MADDDPRAKQHLAPATRLEWVVAGVCALATLGLFGFIASEAVTHAGGQPQLALAVRAVREAAGQTLAVVEIANTGRATAANVDVVGSVSVGQAGQTSTATLDYAPAGSTEQVTLVFEGRVTVPDIAVRVSGWVEP